MGMHDMPFNVLNPKWVGLDDGSRVGFVFDCPTCAPKPDGTAHPIFVAIDKAWADKYEMKSWASTGTTWESLSVTPDVVATSHKCAFAGRIKRGRIEF